MSEEESVPLPEQENSEPQRVRVLATVGAIIDRFNNSVQPSDQYILENGTRLIITRVTTDEIASRIVKSTGIIDPTQPELVDSKRSSEIVGIAAVVTRLVTRDEDITGVDNEALALVTLNPGDTVVTQPRDELFENRVEGVDYAGRLITSSKSEEGDFKLTKRIGAVDLSDGRQIYEVRLTSNERDRDKKPITLEGQEAISYLQFGLSEGDQLQVGEDDSFEVKSKNPDGSYQIIRRIQEKTFETKRDLSNPDTVKLLEQNNPPIQIIVKDSSTLTAQEITDPELVTRALKVAVPIGTYIEYRSTKLTRLVEKSDKATGKVTASEVTNRNLATVPLPLVADFSATTIEEVIDQNIALVFRRTQDEITTLRERSDALTGENKDDLQAAITPEPGLSNQVEKSVNPRVNIFRGTSQLATAVQIMLSRPEYAAALQARVNNMVPIIESEGIGIKSSDKTKNPSLVTRPLMAALYVNPDTAYITAEAVHHDLVHRSDVATEKLASAQYDINDGNTESEQVLRNATCNVFVVGTGVIGSIFMDRVNKVFGPDVKIFGVNNETSLSVFDKLGPDAIYLNNTNQAVRVGEAPGPGRDAGSLSRYGTDAQIQVASVSGTKYATNTEIARTVEANTLAADATLFLGMTWLRTESKLDQNGDVIPGREKWPTRYKNICQDAAGEEFAVFAEAVVNAGGLGEDTYGGLEKNETVERYKGNGIYTYLEYMNLPMDKLIEAGEIAIIGGFKDSARTAAEKAIRVGPQLQNAPRRDTPGSIGSPVQAGDVRAVYCDMQYQNCKEMLVGYVKDTATGERVDIDPAELERRIRDGEELSLQRVEGIRGRYMLLDTEMQRDQNDPRAIDIPRRLVPIVDARCIDVAETDDLDGKPRFKVRYSDGTVKEVGMVVFCTGQDNETRLVTGLQDRVPAIRDPDEIETFIASNKLRAGDIFDIDGRLVRVKQVTGNDIVITDLRGGELPPDINFDTVTGLQTLVSGEITKIIPNDKIIRGKEDVATYVFIDLQVGDVIESGGTKVTISSLTEETVVYRVENTDRTLTRTRTELVNNLTRGFDPNARVSIIRNTGVRTKGFLGNEDLFDVVDGQVEGADAPAPVAKQVKGEKIYVIGAPAGLVSVKETVGIGENAASYALNGNRAEGAAAVIGRESQFDDQINERIRLPAAEAKREPRKYRIQASPAVSTENRRAARALLTEIEGNDPIVNTAAIGTQDEEFTLIQAITDINDQDIQIDGIVPARVGSSDVLIEPNIVKIQQTKEIPLNARPEVVVNVRRNGGTLLYTFSLEVTVDNQTYTLALPENACQDIVTAFERDKSTRTTNELLSGWTARRGQEVDLHLPLRVNGTIDARGAKLISKRAPRS